MKKSKMLGVAWWEIEKCEECCTGELSGRDMKREFAKGENDKVFWQKYSRWEIFPLRMTWLIDAFI